MMNPLFITFLLSILILMLCIILCFSKGKDGLEYFKNKKYSKEQCNEFAKDRCFYLRNTSEWYNCVEETLNYC